MAEPPLPDRLWTTPYNRAREGSCSQKGCVLRTRETFQEGLQDWRLTAVATRDEPKIRPVPQAPRVGADSRGAPSARTGSLPPILREPHGHARAVV